MQNKSYSEQLGRLINYAKALGITVYFRQRRRGDDAAHWTLDNSEITIFERKNQSKLQTILALIHELGHALDFIHNKNREYDHKLAEALDKTDKKSRKMVYDAELAGVGYWHLIYKEVNLTFPIRRMELEMDYDMYSYEIYWKTGEFPTTKQLSVYKRQLRRKYGYK